MYGFIMTCIEI